MNKNGFGPKVLVELRTVSLLGWWKTEGGVPGSQPTGGQQSNILTRKVPALDCWLAHPPLVS